MSKRTANKVPQIRFKGFEGEWEKKPLNQVSDVRDGTHESPNYQPSGHPLVTSKNVKDGWVNYDSVQFISSSDFDAINQRSKVDKGDILMGMIGTIGNTALIREDPDFAIKNVALIKLSKAINENYLYQYFQTQQFNRQLEGSSEGGTQKFISLTKIRSLVVTKSSLPEQTKIGGYFRELDRLIGLHQRKHNKLVTLKKAMLQKMFPQPGTTTPEIRFKGFSGDWVEKKLGDIATYKNGKGHEDRQSSRGKYELINLNSISISGGLKHSGKFIDEADETLKEDDLVMILSDVAHGNLLGRVARIPENDRFVLNQRVALLRPWVSKSSTYLLYQINAHQSYFKLRGAGMSQLNISKNVVTEFTLLTPTETEQQKIGTYFRKLDELISKHATQLQKLQQIKSACLEKMFV